jgi:5-methylcytosine-specific restriction endonuclease McrA
MTPRPKPTTIRLTGKAYQKLRNQCFNDSNGTCWNCGAFAPLLDHNGDFDLFACGHLSHIKSRGAGGGDTINNVRWSCPECHLQAEHGPRWSKTGAR